MLDSSSVKARLNLHAVLKNLEDLVDFDSEAAALVKGRDLSIQFSVMGGPKGYVELKSGTCTVGAGGCPSGASIRLLFRSPEHLNRMFEGQANPIPLWGFNKLGFLAKEFTQLTKRLEYYLRPNDQLLQDPKYLELNTRLTLHTALRACAILGMYEPLCRTCAAGIRNGVVGVTVLPDGPSGALYFKDGDIVAKKGPVEKPHALMQFKSLRVANDVLNSRIDTYVALVKGDVSIRGQIGMVDSLNLILDRVPGYLQ